MQDDTTTDIIRRRRQREAAARRAWVAAGVAMFGLLFVVSVGLLAYAKWPRNRAVIAVGNGGAVIAVGTEGAASDEPTDTEWADLLNHQWWKGQITKSAASKLLDELGSGRQVAVYFNRRGKSVTIQDDNVITYSLEKADRKYDLVRQLGGFKVATVSHGPGGRSNRREAYRAIWKALEDESYGDRSRSTP
jgi:hypothetical protein